MGEEEFVGKIEDIEQEKMLENVRKVEAALFISGRFLSLKELISLTDVNPIFLRKALEDLTDKYKGSGLQIVKRDDMWKMDVGGNYAWLVNKLAGGTSEFTRAEQETLAVIAYKQPIKQSVLIKMRGNKAYEHVAKFVQLGLINKKKVGHTSDLSLNDTFHEYFHVNDKGES